MSKHDGFRFGDAKSVTLHTRRGYDFADRFPLGAAAVAKLPVKSCPIDHANGKPPRPARP